MGQRLAAIGWNIGATWSSSVHLSRQPSALSTAGVALRPQQTRFLSQLSQEPEELACFTAFYKLWQCAGSFSAFFLSAALGSYRLEYWSNVVLIGALIAPTVCAIHSGGRFASTADKISEPAESEQRCGDCQAVEHEKSASVNAPASCHGSVEDLEVP